jgi:LPXTG-site transpeptidase (sortase) family protein
MKSYPKKIHPVSLAFVLLIALFVSTNALALGVLERVSVDSTGTEGDNSSNNPSTSNNGRYIAFESTASNLVAGDTNGNRDVFVHDRDTNTTTRVSVGPSGTEGNSDSYDPSISSDGRYVAFESEASNLVALDTNGELDIFVHDRITHTTTRVSVDSTGAEGDDESLDPSISGDGRYVAFVSSASNLVALDTNGADDIFVHNRDTNTTTRVSVGPSGTEGNSDSYDPSISSDGRYVAFDSGASNLVAGDTNGQGDIFVHDRDTDTTTRVSIHTNGTTEGNNYSYTSSISSDGRYVAFVSVASNLVAGDTNGSRDIFVHDRDTNTTTRVSIDSTGTEGDRNSYDPSISSDGRYIAFYSYASNLVAGDTNGVRDLFLHDRITGNSTRVSIDSTGTEGNSGSGSASISGDGRYVAFDSGASNLVAGDTNGDSDIFVSEVDFTAPSVTADDLDANYPSGSGPNSFSLTYNDAMTDPSGNTNAGDVSNPANYLLAEAGANQTFDTTSCAGGLAGDDVKITTDGVTYTTATYVVDTNINGGTALPDGSYRLFVCGTTSVYDGAGNVLNGWTAPRSDHTIDFIVGALAPSTLPETGFRHGRISLLPQQPAAKAYTETAMLLEIPKLGVSMPIVGVPQSGDGWDVTWLGNSAGYLAGSAFPTWAGNTVITGHVWDSFNKPGLFAELKSLKYGDQVEIHAWGLTYTYEVRESKLVTKKNVNAAFKSEEYDWLTLVTCEFYNPFSGDYLFRRAVRAVLIKVE